MKVILLQDVKDIGKKDDIVNVSDGYARNYLFPRKWAMEATENAVRVVERKREAERRREAEARAAAEQTAAKLKNKVVILKAKCGEKGRLYGSVTAQEVADAIQAGYEVEIDKRKVGHILDLEFKHFSVKFSLQRIINYIFEIILSIFEYIIIRL